MVDFSIADPSASRARAEATIHEHLEAADVRAAVTLTLRLYGAEVLGFLGALTKDSDAAADVFSVFCEDVWRGLPAFRWESSLRTWLYVVARRARSRYGRQGHERKRLPLDEALLEVQVEVRTQTATFQRTETKSAVRELRAALTSEEQSLLMLRVDRSLPWTDIARIMLSEEADTDEDAIKREAAACRKRFERAKERLKELARAQGLLKSPKP